MKSKNTKQFELVINGKKYQSKKNSRGTQLFENNLWYYYREIKKGKYVYKRMIALWVETPQGKKRITRETEWLNSISEVNKAVEDLRVDFRRGNLIYSPKIESVDLAKKTYSDVFEEVCSFEKQFAIETGKDNSYKKIVSHHKNYVMNNNTIDIFKMYVADLTIADIKMLKNSINNDALKYKKSRQTIMLVFGSIDQVLRHCYEKNYTERLLYDVPIKPQGLARRKIGVEGFLTKSQFDEVINVFTDNYIISKKDNCKINEYRKNLYRTALQFLYFTGVRKAELFAIKWEDISENSFSIKRSLNAVATFARDKDLSYREVTPKTENGVRTQTLPTTLRNVLNEWKSICIDFGLSVDPNEYIFREANGVHFVNTTFSRIFNKIIKDSNVEHKYNKNINVHSMRHSACSYLVTEMKKKDPSASLMMIEDAVGQYLGHSVGGSMVREIYNHYYGEEEDSLLDQVLLSI